MKQGGAYWFPLNPEYPHHCVCNGSSARFGPILRRQPATAHHESVRQIQVGIHRRAKGHLLVLPRVSFSSPCFKELFVNAKDGFCSNFRIARVGRNKRSMRFWPQAVPVPYTGGSLFPIGEIHLSPLFAPFCGDSADEPCRWWRLEPGTNVRALMKKERSPSSVRLENC